MLAKPSRPPLIAKPAPSRAAAVPPAAWQPNRTPLAVSLDGGKNLTAVPKNRNHGIRQHQLGLIQQATLPLSIVQPSSSLATNRTTAASSRSKKPPILHIAAAHDARRAAARIAVIQRSAQAQPPITPIPTRWRNYLPSRATGAAITKGLAHLTDSAAAAASVVKAYYGRDPRRTGIASGIAWATSASANIGSYVLAPTTAEDSLPRKAITYLAEGANLAAGLAAAVPSDKSAVAAKVSNGFWIGAGALNAISSATSIPELYSDWRLGKAGAGQKLMAAGFQFASAATNLAAGAVGFKAAEENDDDSSGRNAASAILWTVGAATGMAGTILGVRGQRAARQIHPGRV